MAEQIIEGRVIQKIATVAEWSASTLPLKKGEFAIVSDSTGKPINIRVGDGVNVFSGLVDMFDNIQQNVNFIAVSSNALPTPTIDTGYTFVSEGSYTFGGSPAFTVPAGHWGTANWDGNSWSFTDLGALPSAPVANDFGTSENEAISQARATETNNRVEVINSLIFSGEGTEQNYNQSNLIADSFWSFNGLAVGDQAPLNTSASTDWTYMPVFTLPIGTTIELRTRGGASANGYAVSGLDREIKILAPANVNTLTEPFIHTITEESLFYVNCRKLDIANFALKITLPAQNNFERLENEIEIVSTSVQDNKTNSDLRFDGIDTHLSEVDENLEQINGVLFNSTTETITKTGADLQNSVFWSFYQLSVGDQAPTTKSSSPTWKCIDTITLPADAQISVTTRGGSSAFGYALTNTSGQIILLSPSDVNTLTTPWVYTTTQDSILYVNCRQDYTDQFNVTINIESGSTIEKLTNDVDVLKNQVANIEGGISVPRFKNNPFPINNTTLKILAIGNSFTDDPTSLLGSFITASGIPSANVCLYRLTQSGASLENWLSNYNNASYSGTATRALGQITMPVVTGSVAAIVGQDWDIIIIQQASALAIDYNTFNPYLTQLIYRLRRDCTNQKLALAWQLPWANAANGGPNNEPWGDAPHGMARYNALVASCQSMIANDGIDIIIPTGTAIQNARMIPSLNGGYDMTRDGIHLAYGVSRYIASATWFYILFCPVFNVPLLGNGARRVPTATELENPYTLAVNETNYLVCQRAALLACLDMWSVNNPS